MKYLKIFEADSITKHIDYLNDKFDVWATIKFFKEEDIYYINLKFSDYIRKNKILMLIEEFNDYDFVIRKDQDGVQVKIYVTQEYIDKLDIDMESKKYNI